MVLNCFWGNLILLVANQSVTDLSQPSAFSAGMSQELAN